MPREPISKDIMHFEPPYSILRNPVKGDRVKDTDFGDIFDLSPIAVLFTQILFEGVSYRYLQQNCFSIYLNCNQNLCLSFQQYMLYVSYRFW